MKAHHAILLLGVICSASHRMYSPEYISDAADSGYATVARSDQPADGWVTASYGEDEYRKAGVTAYADETVIEEPGKTPVAETPEEKGGEPINSSPGMKIVYEKAEAINGTLDPSEGGLPTKPKEEAPTPLPKADVKVEDLEPKNEAKVEDVEPEKPKPEPKKTPKPVAVVVEEKHKTITAGGESIHLPPKPKKKDSKDSVGKTFDRIAGIMSKIFTRVKTNEKSISDLQNKVVSDEKRLTSLESRVSSLENKIDQKADKSWVQQNLDTLKRMIEACCGKKKPVPALPPKPYVPAPKPKPPVSPPKVSEYEGESEESESSEASAPEEYPTESEAPESEESEESEESMAQEGESSEEDMSQYTAPAHHHHRARHATMIQVLREVQTFLTSLDGADDQDKAQAMRARLESEIEKRHLVSLLGDVKGYLTTLSAKPEDQQADFEKRSVQMLKRFSSFMTETIGGGYNVPRNQTSLRFS